MIDKYTLTSSSAFHIAMLEEKRILLYLKEVYQKIPCILQGIFYILLISLFKKQGNYCFLASFTSAKRTCFDLISSNTVMVLHFLQNIPCTPFDSILVSHSFWAPHIPHSIDFCGSTITILAFIFHHLFHLIVLEIKNTTDFVVLFN